ncbi:class I SAM-dependent methyltransferase [Nonomuraea rhodomycinica]|uniref:Methyltransferase domain-containing protein n=1 Tax=Nonomuraea rhodomycinica TaxID=1712872 RepID=A0A7Y6MDK6_9ACTN|nr:methyltransferase domain-containing protein [Nonomuraea rhodomycinica]NUW42811.1 methyltransferase domain-containing protein [Nonomuraea rhodomycinica]
MIYEHPLAYLLGVEGVALLRSFRGEHDRDFVEARLGEIRRLLGDEALVGAAVEVADVDAVEGYRVWSGTYDGPNGLFDIEEPVVGRILDGLPAGDALDAACGTGRVAAALAGRGHRVIGVDGSPDMLARARARVPRAVFSLGDLGDLPVPDDAVDLVVCSLALTHVPSLGPAMAEFARVLRPGGHLVISDMHPEGVARGFVPPVRLADGRPGRIATYRHAVGDYLRAALSAGLQVRRCEEPRIADTPPAHDTPPAADTSPQVEAPPEAAPSSAEVVAVWDVWPWSLAGLVPEAARAAYGDVPSMLIWHFQLPASGS